MSEPSPLVTVFPRDRSFYRSRPNNTPKRLHRDSAERPGMAACDTRFILLDTDGERAVPPEHPLLCRRCFRSKEARRG